MLNSQLHARLSRGNRPWEINTTMVFPQVGIRGAFYIRDSSWMDNEENDFSHIQLGRGFYIVGFSLFFAMMEPSYG